MPRKKLQGIVVSDKMQRTVVVKVERQRRHPRYLKIVRRHKKFKAHNDLGAREGDLVRIEETKPLSKTKRWQVVEILRRASR